MDLQVLFVDDDPFLLQAIERSLVFSCPQWDTQFATSAESAIELLNERPFDVVVSDMRMPGIDGAQLLEYVSQIHPATIRIILSGQSDLECAFRTFGPAHQYLCKPCQVKELRAVLDRATNLRDHLDSEPIKRMVASLKTLPALPESLARLNQILDSQTASANDVAAEIGKNIGITAKILRMANSPMFGPGRTVINIAEAVAFLGFEVVHSLFFSFAIFSRFEKLESKQNFVHQLTTHCVQVGARAIAIARLAGASSETQNNSLLAGLFHDLGKLVLADQFPDSFAEAMQAAESLQIPQWQTESQIYNATHADISAYLLALWGISNPVVEAVAFHHQPELAKPTKFSPLSAVYIANELENADRQTNSSDTLQRLKNYCDSISFDFRLEDLQKCGQPAEVSE